MKTKVLLLLLVVIGSIKVVCGKSNADKDSTEVTHPGWDRFKERIYFGGDIGASFGTLTFIDVSPLIGYRITDRFSMGIGTIYQYYNYKVHSSSGATYNISSSMYGGKMFARELITDRLYLYSEVDVLNLEGYNVNTDEIKRVNVPLLLVGGGYLFPIGNSASFGLNILVDLIDDPYSPFSNPIFRGGFVFGL